MSQKPIAIYGAGGQGREVLQLINHINRERNEWRCVGWFDDGIEKGTEIAGLHVLGGIKELNEWKEDLAITIAIGIPAVKKNVWQQIENPKIYYPTLIHPSVRIDESEVELGEGTIIQAGNLFTVNVKVGKHVLVNLNCTIAHDAHIGDFCGIMPSVNVSGEVQVEDEVYIGTGTQIIQQKTIGRGSIIGAGAVVTTDIPSRCTAVGIPAKPIKFHE